MDTALKQRLIGAAVLIALAVFFLPMLVKGPAPDSGVSDVSMEIDEGPTGAMETRDLPLLSPGDVPKGGAVGMDATPVDRPSSTLPETGSVAPTEQAAGDDVVTPTEDGAAALPPAAAGGDYAVHFGAYATQKAADTVVALVKRAQLPAYSEPTKIGEKDAWRVRIGPYAARADAESARLKALDVRNDVPVRVVTLNTDATPTSPTPAPAEAAAPAPSTEAPKPIATTPAEPAKAEAKPEAKPAIAKPETAKPETAKPAVSTPPKPVATNPTTKPAELPAPPKSEAKPAGSGSLVAVAPKPKPAAAAKVGFAVQLGAFGNPADATALRDRLRASGFAAFTETVDTDKGKLTRVRVGPVVDRAAADQLKAQVRAKTGVDGIVRSHP
jgi:cell division septation protein DedD